MLGPVELLERLLLSELNASPAGSLPHPTTHPDTRFKVQDARPPTAARVSGRKSEGGWMGLVSCTLHPGGWVVLRDLRFFALPSREADSGAGIGYATSSGRVRQRLVGQP